VRPVRMAMSRVISRLWRLAPGQGERLLESRCAKAVRDLEDQGLTELEPLLSQEAVGKMLAYFVGLPAVAPDGSRARLNQLPVEVVSASYDLATVIGCPGLIELVNSPAILKIASAYLGCQPTVSGLGVLWSLPNSDLSLRSQGFQRDFDDWRLLKLFIYLTDVTATSGPHRYVRTSHHFLAGFHKQRYDLAEVIASFGGEKLRTLTGPAGTTFMADTRGIHHGGVPTRGARLILQAQYSLLLV
jgi:hypothetical protein